jgi:6,7-dimethyl-8-ribityllumazine synthase
LDAGELRVAIAVSRWNELITERLLGGALECIRMHGGKPEEVSVAWCPGSFELPLVVQRLAASGEFDAVVALGCVIRGATPHFDHISAQAVNGVSQVMLATNIPCALGVLTVDTIEQAIERAGTKAGNKGWEATQAAIEMASLMKTLP